MTKIYTYCLFNTVGEFLGVYSSLRSIHRDALKLSNRASSSVYMIADGVVLSPSLTGLRNFFKGKCDIEVVYRTSAASIRILKTKLKE
jgi:hypothetical protein